MLLETHRHCCDQIDHSLRKIYAITFRLIPPFDSRPRSRRNPCRFASRIYVGHRVFHRNKTEADGSGNIFPCRDCFDGSISVKTVLYRQYESAVTRVDHFSSVADVSRRGKTVGEVRPGDSSRTNKARANVERHSENRCETLGEVPRGSSERPSDACAFTAAENVNVYTRVCRVRTV